MKKKIFTVVSAIFVSMIALVDNAKADQVQHLIVMDQDSVEQASFNTETIDNLLPGNDLVEIEVTVDGQTKLYPYNRETSMFGFAMRERGTATSNETISQVEWQVSYTQGKLHISQPVGKVSIYSIMGQMLGQYPNQTNIDVYLNPGIYIIQSGEYAAKLLVNPQNTGKARVATKAAYSHQKQNANSDPPTWLKAADSGDQGLYWNVGSGDIFVPVEIDQIKVFKFSAADVMVVEYKNGNSTEISAFQSSFALSNQANNGDWNWELTSRLGGAAYGFDPGTAARKAEYISAFSSTHLIIYDVMNKKEYRYKINDIPIDLLNRYDAVVSMFTGHPAISYKIIENDEQRIYYDDILDPVWWGSSPAWGYEFNNMTNRINAKVKANPDGSLTVTYSNFDGDFREQIIKK